MWDGKIINAIEELNDLRFNILKSCYNLSWYDLFLAIKNIKNG